MDIKPYTVQDGGSHWYYLDRYGCKHTFFKNSIPGEIGYDYDDVVGFADGEKAYDYDRH